ncbi:hypothetical protein Tco_0336365 [Tanacetum coccineum]
MESLMKKKQKGAILELKRRHLKNTIFCTYTPYPAMKIRRISANSTQETRNDQFPIRRIHYNQYAVCTSVHQSRYNLGDGGFDDIKDGEKNGHATSRNYKFKIGDEFLKILQDNTFNGMNGEVVTDHIARVLEITE